MIPSRPLRRQSRSKRGPRSEIVHFFSALLIVIPSRADGEGPHEVRRMFEACEVLRFAQDDAQ